MISIVIPSYNQRDFLADAIDSALLNKPDEIIIVDDGSTDHSLEIAQKYATEHPNIKVISHVNKGLASARNTGIMNATNDWILFLDADDILMEGSLEKIQKVIDATDADIIAPSFKTFGTSNEIVQLMPNPTLEDFRTGNRIAYCAMFRKSALLEVGGYSPRMTWGYEDLHLTINLLSRGKSLVTIPEPLWLYRTKEHSMIHDAQAHHQELLDIINKDFPNALLNF